MFDVYSVNLSVTVSSLLSDERLTCSIFLFTHEIYSTQLYMGLFYCMRDISSLSLSLSLCRIHGEVKRVYVAKRIYLDGMLGMTILQHPNSKLAKRIQNTICRVTQRKKYLI